MLDDLIKEMDDCIEAFELTGALPSPLMERTYGMLRAVQSDAENQKYISFMVMNYFAVRFGGDYK